MLLGCSEHDGKKLLMQEESSLWVCIDQHSGLIGANANNREVMDSDWTSSAEPGGTSFSASPTHRPFINVCRPGANLNVTGALSGRDSDEGGPLEAMVQWLITEGYKLCFLHLIQHKCLKVLIRVLMCPFFHICLVCPCPINETRLSSEQSI